MANPWEATGLTCNASRMVKLVLDYIQCAPFLGGRRAPTMASAFHTTGKNSWEGGWGRGVSDGTPMGSHRRDGEKGQNPEGGGSTEKCEVQVTEKRKLRHGGMCTNDLNK